MDSNKNYAKLRQELSELERQVFNSKKSEEIKSVLKNLDNLGGTISQSLKDADAAAKEICNGTNLYELEYDNTLYIGKDSVKSLVELKHTASDLFADIKENNGRELEEEINFDPLYKDLENMEKAQASNQEFIKFMELSLKGLKDIYNDQNKKDKCESSESESKSTISMNPSALDFTSFENNATNVKTSSPFPNN